MLWTSFPSVSSANSRCGDVGRDRLPPPCLRFFLAAWIMLDELLNFFIMQRCSATGIVTSFPSEKVWFAEETRHQVARRGGDFQWKGAKVRGFHSNFSAFPCHQIVMNYLNNMLRTNFGHFSGANEGSNCAMIKSWSDRRPCFVQSLA